MQYVTPDLCDAYPDLIQVVEPIFSNFGGRDSFGGEIVTVKCFEDNSLVKEQVELDGTGKVMVVDGGAAPPGGTGGRGRWRDSTPETNCCTPRKGRRCVPMPSIATSTTSPSTR